MECDVTKSLKYAVDVSAGHAHVRREPTIADASAIAEDDNMMDHARRHLAGDDNMPNFEASDCYFKDEVV